MANYTYTKRFAVLGHQRVSRCELEDMRAYARLATALMTSESEKHTAHVDNVWQTGAGGRLCGDHFAKVGTCS